MRKTIIFFLLIAAAFAGGLYQNCSRVPLERPSLVGKLVKATGKISLCLDGAYGDDTVESAMVMNLNLIPSGNDIDADSDGDGLSDQMERQYGFDPLKRRTSGKYLDKICLDLAGGNDCSGVSVGCSKTPNKLGLSDCDYKVLGLDLLYGHPDQGLDSDKDGLPDLVEILRATYPNQSDALSDPDHDLVRNVDEITRGSNTVVHDQPFKSRYKVQTAMEKLPDSSDCAGEKWELDIRDLPWTPLAAMKDDLESSLPADALSFTRPKDTNTGVVILKLTPQVGRTGNAKILIRPLILGERVDNLDGTLKDFFSAGEVQP